MTSPPASPARPKSRPRSHSLSREVAIVCLLAVAISFVLKTFLVQSFSIPSESMEQTLLVGDRILVNRQVSGEEVSRGDVVVFEDPGGWLPPVDTVGGPVGAVRDALAFVGLAPVAQGHVVKRVIGLPGDRVRCCDAQGRLLLNGEVVTESYLFPGDEPSDRDFDVTVPPGSLWLMGDHRSVSGDSRVHRDEPGGGFVPMDKVVGRVFAVVWPLGRAGGIDGP